jgi:hypothetical protein
MGFIGYPGGWDILKLIKIVLGLIINMLLRYGIVLIFHKSSLISEHNLSKIWYITSFPSYNLTQIRTQCLDNNHHSRNSSIKIHNVQVLEKLNENYNYMQIISIME